MFISAGNPHRKLYNIDKPLNQISYSFPEEEMKNNAVKNSNTAKDRLFQTSKMTKLISSKAATTKWTILFWTIKFDLKKLDDEYYEKLNFFNGFENNRKVKLDFFQLVKSKIEHSGLLSEEKNKLYLLMVESRTSRYRQFGCSHGIRLTETQQLFLNLANQDNIESEQKRRLPVYKRFF